MLLLRRLLRLLLFLLLPSLVSVLSVVVVARGSRATCSAEETTDASTLSLSVFLYPLFPSVLQKRKVCRGAAQCTEFREQTRAL